MPIFALSDKYTFPPAHLAEKEGLLAIGGDLEPERILTAYKNGIFPWYSEDEPILWWSPNPRLVLFPEELKISKSLRKVINKEKFTITMDLAFKDVVKACAQVRLQKDEGTWITDEMINAYSKLHTMGYAHSVEAWQEDRLVGGLYGLSLGKCFFGESMFSTVSNASKVAFAQFVAHLISLDFDLIDCQVKTDHLVRFGAREIPRKKFLDQLERSLRHPTLKGPWKC